MVDLQASRHGIRRRVCALVVASLAVPILAGCSTIDHGSDHAVSKSFRSGVLPPEQNLGDANDLRAVRSATVTALSHEARVFVVDQGLRGKNPSSVMQALTAPGPTRKRMALLSSSHSHRLATRVEQAFEFYLRQDFGPDWPGSGSRDGLLARDVWSSRGFHVDRWDGVRVAGDTARVLVRGEDRGTAWGGTAVRDSWAQEQLILHRDPTAADGWRVVEHRAASTAA